MDPFSETPPPTPAEQAFLEHLARRERGSPQTLEELVRAHPQLGAELRALAQRWQRFEALRGLALEAGPAPTEAERAESQALLALAALDEPRRPIERYELGEELARGAQGSVRRVLDKQLERFLAMKVLHGAQGSASSPARVLRRFLDEARITARLDHPSIVPVHELGLDREGRAFFTMKLVRGISLREAFDEHARGSATWTLPRLAEVLLRVAEAMAFAHDRGVLHRDLKPSNVMLGEYGEVYVMDWGLARRAPARDRPAGERAPADPSGGASAPADPSEGASAPTDPSEGAPEPDPTLQGDVLGTPHYMPPEQAEGRHSELDTAADIYALGALLYHLLTGRAPYAEVPSSTAHEVLRRVRAGPPPPVAELAPAAPAELEAICAKAMQRAPEQRYASMAELAADLRAWLEGRVVRAYERGAWAELRKWVRRNRALAAASLALLAAVIGGLWWSAQVEARGRRAAEEARAEADANLADLKRLSDVLVLDELDQRTETLWPELPAQLGALRAWVREARELAQHLPAHEQTLARLRAGSESVSGLERSWWEGTLAELVERLRSFEQRAIPEVEARLRFAETIQQRSIEDERAAWDEARRSIAADARYGGLALEPIAGLVPLGQDPASGLWEFCHLRSGARPARDAQGALVLEESSGLVLVLLPGGHFWMGAQKLAPSSPNYDPAALDDEQPLVDVRLDAFLLSKYEMTQGQWLRATGSNPSRDEQRGSAAGREQTLLHPVDFVSWTECKRTLAHLDLALPTEAQWEYGARAGTQTPWWTGAERESLRGAANIADRSAREAGMRWDELADCPDFADGFVFQAPVGKLAANAFGLHDVLGNVFEWTSDMNSDYQLGRRDGDGAGVQSELTPILRGGSYYFGTAGCRVALRSPATPDFAAPMIGLRPARALR